MEKHIIVFAAKNVWTVSMKVKISLADMTAIAAIYHRRKWTSFLKEGVPYVIRQKMPVTGSTTFVDAVYGEITIENSELEDQILIKSDGYPTYNFANVIDDHLMHITHVVRGCEYLTSTPKYNLLYEAFGWELPTYVHLPMIMGKMRMEVFQNYPNVMVPPVFPTW